jgi:hypothetical protein
MWQAAAQDLTVPDLSAEPDRINRLLDPASGAKRLTGHRTHSLSQVLGQAGDRDSSRDGINMLPKFARQVGPRYGSLLSPQISWCITYDP